MPKVARRPVNWLSAGKKSFAIIGAKEFDQHSVPGKLMGFASYGKYSEKMESWLKRNNYFQDIWSRKVDFFEKVKEEFQIDLKGFDTGGPRNEIHHEFWKCK